MYIIVTADDGNKTAYHVPTFVRNNSGRMKFLHEWMKANNATIRHTAGGASERLHFQEWWTPQMQQAEQQFANTQTQPLDFTQPNILAQVNPVAAAGLPGAAAAVGNAPGTNVPQSVFDNMNPAQQMVAQAPPHIDAPRQWAYSSPIPGSAYGGGYGIGRIGIALANPMGVHNIHQRLGRY